MSEARWRGWCRERGNCGATATESAAGGTGERTGDAAVAEREAPQCDLPVGLDPGLIPLRDWPLHKWYFADPLWYYHAPGTHHRLSDDPKFTELVDPPLRELCRLARAAGVTTTPSCSGHFYVKERFLRIWENLLRDADAIRGRGLTVQDSEMERCHVFRDPAYRVPWPRFDAFLAEADAYQRQGYIGLALPAGAAELEQRLRDDAFATSAARVVPEAELSRILGRPLFGVHVDPPGLDARDATWAEVTAYLRAALQRG